MSNLTPITFSSPFCFPLFQSRPGTAGKTASPYSQNGTGQTETLKVTTRIVVLDVVVTDKKGNLVSS